MSTTTTNLGLIKPELTDSADITAYNGNWDKIDEKLGNVDSHAQSKSNPHGVTPDQIGAAPSTHNHSASEINSGTLNSNRLPTVPLTKGGTGATTATQALANLGAAPKTHSHTKSDISDFAHTHSAGEINSGTLSTDRLPTIPVNKGGTGATTAAQALVNLGAAAVNHGHDSNGISSLINHKRFETEPPSGSGMKIYGMSTGNGRTFTPGLWLITTKGYTHIDIGLDTDQTASMNARVNVFKQRKPPFLLFVSENTHERTEIMDVARGIVAVSELNEDGETYTVTTKNVIDAFYSSSTYDLTPGETTLETGKLHFVYE